MSSTWLPLCQIDGELGARMSGIEVSVSAWLLAVGAKSAEQSGEEVDAAVEEAMARAKPKPSGQRGLAEPEGQMPKANYGFDHTYNEHGVVGEEILGVLVTEVADEASNINRLVPMIENTEEPVPVPSTQATANTYLVDVNYRSEDNLGRPTASVSRSSSRLDTNITARGSRRHLVDRSKSTPPDVSAWPYDGGRRGVDRLREVKGYPQAHPWRNGDLPTHRTTPSARQRRCSRVVDAPHHLPQHA